MSSIRNGMDASALADVAWIKSRRSGPTGGNCVEIAFLGSGEIAVRDLLYPIIFRSSVLVPEHISRHDYVAI